MRALTTKSREVEEIHTRVQEVIDAHIKDIIRFDDKTEVVSGTIAVIAAFEDAGLITSKQAEVYGRRYAPYLKK